MKSPFSRPVKCGLETIEGRTISDPLHQIIKVQVINRHPLSLPPLADIWEKSKGPDDFHLHDVDKVRKEDVVTAVRLGQVCTSTLDVHSSGLMIMLKQRLHFRPWTTRTSPRGRRSSR